MATIIALSAVSLPVTLLYPDVLAAFLELQEEFRQLPNNLHILRLTKPKG